MSILLHGQNKSIMSWSQWSPDAQSLFSMTENDSNGNAGKKQKRQCDLSLSHASSPSFIGNNARHGDGGGTDWLVRSAMLGKNIEKTGFWSDLVILKKETRSIRSRSLSKEEIDFHLLMALSFHHLPRMKVMS